MLRSQDESPDKGKSIASRKTAILGPAVHCEGDLALAVKVARALRCARQEGERRCVEGTEDQSRSSAARQRRPEQR